MRNDVMWACLCHAFVIIEGGERRTATHVVVVGSADGLKTREAVCVEQCPVCREACLRKARVLLCLCVLTSENAMSKAVKRS